MQEAIRRHETGEARVIPIILRACDWKTAPFGALAALPKNAKPVMTWTDRDTAFTDIARGIRTVVDEVNGKLSMTPSEEKPTNKKKGTKSGEEVRKPHMLSAPTLNTAVLKKTIANYYKELEDYKSKADSELSLRNAFQSLLADMARHVKWTLVAEQTLEKGIRPDGVVRDDYFARGYWEAKGPKGNLGQEIDKKIKQGYPLTNTIFENTQEAVLYQNKKLFARYDLGKPNDVSDLISQFFTYTEPDIENFETAVQEFKERIPELAKAVLTRIEGEYKANKRFITAFNTFAELCRTSLDPKITTDVLNEMLIQHLLTERLFRTIFDNTDFVRRNVIAAEIEKVIDALASRSFNRNDFLKSLDRFYVAIEAAAKGIETWSEQQHFLNTVYERFFQGYSVKRADTFGINYTPQEIVDFMCESVIEISQREFGKSIFEPGVQILDPATGTGSFIVNLLQRTPSRQLKYKYQHDFFCNEIMLLPYYIASLNIEHVYYGKMGEYEPFEGVCFVDTLELAEGQQLPLFVEENTKRVQSEKEAQIMVVIGNPPYNVGQKNENDNNKNRHYVPYYTYAEDGTNHHENITDWALSQFQAKYNPEVTKWDIFHYIYAMLHHPQYRERYAENLKRDLPHIPLLHTREPFETCVQIGKQLMDMHLNYEQAEEYKLEWQETKDVPFSWRVEKMRLSHDKRALVVNDSLILAPVPPECFEYKLGNRSALEWVIDQYQVSKDARSGIESDPNRLDDEEYIVRLVGKVVTVSVETVRLVNELAQAVKMEDWMDESVALNETEV